LGLLVSNEHSTTKLENSSKGLKENLWGCFIPITPSERFFREARKFTAYFDRKHFGCQGEAFYLGF